MQLPSRLYDFRNRLLASARFRRFASRVWPFRLVARRRAGALFDLCAGFVYSQVLMACVRLDVFERLRDGPLSVARLASGSGLDEVGARRLFDGAVALRLLERRGDGYGLGVLGASIVDNPGIPAMATHHAMLYEDLRDPLALLRGDAGPTELSRYWAYATATDAGGLAPDAVARYSELMAASQPMVAEQVIAAYPLRRHRRLLDVGGGTGAFLREVAAAVPGLELGLFDLPAVVGQLRDDAGGRIRTTGGDFTRDALPGGFDIISLVRIVHDHDDDVVLKILANVRRALPEDGVILIAEPLAGTPGAESVGDAYFGFYLLAMGSGRPRTAEAIDALLEKSGFLPAKRYPTPVPMVASVLAARVNPNL